MLPRAVPLRSRAVLLVVASLAALGLVGTGTAVAHDDVAASVVAHTRPHPHHQDPRRTRGLFVDPLMPAYTQGGVYRRRIGAKAQAFWVIPEAYPTDQVRARVTDYTSRALDAAKTPMLVVYGIPGRDCSQYSAGGLADGPSYRAWVDEIAKGLRHQHALVVLEPDVIGFSTQPQCRADELGWIPLLRYATRKLAHSGAWVYLDAAHSGWTPTAGRAALLKRAGVAHARGISTNVSNFRRSGAEKKYAAGLLRQLRRMGVRGLHYVIDTSRNGAKNPVDGQVINPTWARVGAPPRLRFQGAFDGTLWVKHPGESDGYEQGGPASGQWCDFLADRLLGRPESTSC